ncbi:MAG: hypothetical protein AAF420_03015 [Pseudomonadota bacterium]
MENIPALYLLYLLLGCLLAVVAVWSRRGVWIRAGAVGLLIALVALNYLALVNLLGRPQPIESIASAEIEGDAVVVAATIEEGTAIYLWLRHPRELKPHYYRMDWDQDAAMALKQAMAESLQENSSVMMKPHYEQSLEEDKEPLFYAMPQERLPLKPPPDYFEYRNPGIQI